ncbi:MAG: hypothetical protein JSS40_16660 [Proteobacteria bacterium]|nr:hypothetical protein [Pseudomonadota bacterium]
MSARALAPAALLAAALLAAGCGSMPGTSANREITDPARFLPDVPLPEGTKIDLERTLILGGAPDWTGRVAGVTPLSEEDLIGHFREQLGKGGWKLVSIARSKASIMTFTNATRAATIEVAPAGGFGGSSAFTVVVSPQLGGAAPGQPAPAAGRK